MLEDRGGGGGHLISHCSQYPLSRVVIYVLLAAPVLVLLIFAARARATKKNATSSSNGTTDPHAQHGFASQRLGASSIDDIRNWLDNSDHKWITDGMPALKDDRITLRATSCIDEELGFSAAGPVNTQIVDMISVTHVIDTPSQATGVTIFAKLSKQPKSSRVSASGPRTRSRIAGCWRAEVFPA